MNEKIKNSSRQSPMATMDDLPNDIFFDILSRLPIKPLFTFRSVSKQWCKLIDHPHLSLIHIKQQDPILFILSTPSKNTTFLHFARLHHHHRVPALHASKLPFMEFDFNSFNPSFGFCNGLLYFTHRTPPSPSSSIILSNPLRKESFKLPPINGPSSAVTKTYGLGFDSSTNSFKMVCVFFNECTMILNVGRTSSWRKIPQLPPCPISGTPVFSRGFLYWKVDPCYAYYDNTNSLIVSFDVKNEEFSFVPHPELHSSNSSSLQLLDLNGDLAIVDFGNCESFTVSVMKDYQQKNWVVEYSLSISRSEKVTSLSKDGEILITSSCGFFVYNSTKNDLKYIHDLNGLQSNPAIYSFTGSLFSLSYAREEDY